MKIMLIGPAYPFRGGIAHYVTSLFQALENKHPTKLISFIKQFPRVLYPGRSDKDPSEGVIKVKADYLLDPTNPLSWSRTNDEILRWQPDLVVINWWVTIWSFAYRSIARRAKVLGIPVIYIVHNVLPHESHLWDKQLSIYALGTGNGYIVHTSSQKELLISILPGAQPIQVPHPVYSLFPFQVISRGDARTHLKLPQDVPVFLFFGIVRAYKGLPVLIDAMSKLKQRGRQPHLLIGGEFWHGKDEVMKKITDFGLTSQIHIFDRYIPNEEVAWFLSAANVFVAPYVGGSQSGALALAAGYGLPAIATGIISDSVDLPSTVTLKVIPENDPLALADQMEKFLDDPRILMSEPRSHQGDWNKIVDAITAAYEISLEKKPEKLI